MKAIAVDDEIYMLETLQEAVSASSDIEMVEAFSSCSAALAYATENPVDIAVLTLPREAAPEVVKRLARIGIPGAWNFTSCPLHDIAGNMTIESVHLGDSLMVLCYDLTRKKRDDGSEEVDLADGDTQT